MVKIHRLKTWPEPFDATQRGDKNFEIRKNDRDYKKGDWLVLDRFSPEMGFSSDRVPLVRQAIYVLSGFGLSDGYVAIGLDDCATVEIKKVILELAPRRGEAS